MTTSASFTAALSVSMSDSDDIRSISAAINRQLADAMTGCDAVFSAAAELTAAAVSVDLVGSLADPLKNAVTFASVLGIYIKNTGSLPIAIGGANNIPLLNGSTDKLALAAGKWVLLSCDIDVTAGTGDLVTINSLVSAWSAGTYPVGTIRRHNSVLYEVIDEVETALEPGVSEGWEADWEVIDNESYELVILGIQPEA